MKTTKLLAVAFLAACAGCDSGSSERTIKVERVATHASKPARPGITGMQRFGGGGMEEPQAPPGPRPKPLSWDTPAGWSEKPDATGMRVGSFAIASNPEADCSVTLLPGNAGGVPANVNRWRKQMGQAPLDDAGIAALPKRPLLRQTGVIVDLDGSFEGMEGGARANWKLLGAITQLDLPGLQPIAVFVKLTGPKAAVENERKAFDALCDSLRFASHAGHAPHGDEPHGDQPPGDAPAASMQWTAPPEWKLEGPRPMRLASFRAGTETECYVSEAGGGFLPNVNRWMKQMGQPPLDDKALAAMPAVACLGKQAPVVEATGTYTDANGGAHPGFALLGVAVERDGKLVFVKMVGPEAEVRAERERFRAFAGSLK